MADKEDPDKWDFLPELNKIYRQSPDTKMNSKVTRMPWIKFLNIIENLEELQQELVTNGPPPKPGTLETVMVNWLRDVCPKKVIPKNIRAIHEFACAIGDKVGKLDGDGADGVDGEGDISCPDNSPCPASAMEEIIDQICKCFCNPP